MIVTKKGSNPFPHFPVGDLITTSVARVEDRFIIHQRKPPEPPGYIWQPLSIHYTQVFLYFSTRNCKSRNKGKSFLENKNAKNIYIFELEEKEMKREHYIHLPDIRLPLVPLWPLQEQRKKSARVIWHKAIYLKTCNVHSPPDCQTSHCFICLLRSALCVRKAHWIFFSDLGGRGHLL